MYLTKTRIRDFGSNLKWSGSGLETWKKKTLSFKKPVDEKIWQLEFLFLILFKPLVLICRTISVLLPDGTFNKPTANYNPMATHPKLLKDYYFLSR